MGKHVQSLYSVKLSRITKSSIIGMSSNVFCRLDFGFYKMVLEMDWCPQENFGCSPGFEPLFKLVLGWCQQ